MKILSMRFYAILITIVVLLSSCKRASQYDSPSIVVGIPPVSAIAERIVGDSLQVVCLLPKGGNPETYEPTVSQIAQVEQSDAFLYVNETGFEAVIAHRIHDGAGVPGINVSKGIEMLYGTHGDCPHHHHHGESCDHSHEADPHVWSSAKNARIIAANILSVLQEIDSDRMDYYTANYNRLIAEIDSLDSHLSHILAPHRGKAFVVWHPSLGYFARDYELEQISIGGMENKETSVKQLKDRIEAATKRNVQVFVIQQNYDSRQAQLLNEHLEARIVEIDPLSADWAQQLIDVADAFATE